MGICDICGQEYFLLSNGQIQIYIFFFLLSNGQIQKYIFFFLLSNGQIQKYIFLEYIFPLPLRGGGRGVSLNLM